MLSRTRKTKLSKRSLSYVLRGSQIRMLDSEIMHYRWSRMRCPEQLAPWQVCQNLSSSWHLCTQNWLKHTRHTQLKMILRWVKINQFIFNRKNLLIFAQWLQWWHQRKKATTCLTIASRDQCQLMSSNFGVTSTWEHSLAISESTTTNASRRTKALKSYTSSLI